MSIETLSTLELATIRGGADACPAVAPGTTRDQFTWGAIGKYLTTGGLRATGQKAMDRVKYQLDSDPGNLDRYKAAIHSRPGGDAYTSALQCRDSLPTK
jgi:hypothetical protein